MLSAHRTIINLLEGIASAFGAGGGGSPATPVGNFRTVIKMMTSGTVVIPVGALSYSISAISGLTTVNDGTGVQAVPVGVTIKDGGYPGYKLLNAVMVATSTSAAVVYAVPA